LWSTRVHEEKVLFCIQMLRHTSICWKLKLRWKCFTVVWFILLVWLMGCNVLPRELEPNYPKWINYSDDKKSVLESPNSSAIL
jgi:hypothetical protein